MLVNTVLLRDLCTQYAVFNVNLMQTATHSSRQNTKSTGKVGHDSHNGSLKAHYMLSLRAHV